MHTICVIVRVRRFLVRYSLTRDPLSLCICLNCSVVPQGCRIVYYGDGDYTISIRSARCRSCSNIANIVQGTGSVGRCDSCRIHIAMVVCKRMQKERWYHCMFHSTRCQGYCRHYTNIGVKLVDCCCWSARLHSKFGGRSSDSTQKQGQGWRRWWWW